MPKRNFFIPLLVTLGLSSVPQPAQGQALIPHTLQLDPVQLEEIGSSLLLEASQWGQFQQYDQALPRAKLAAQLLPNNWEAWAILGNLHLQKGESEAAIVALEKARVLQPDNAVILFALGSAHFQNQNYTQAAMELEAGLELEPDLPGALFDLGNAYYLLGNMEEAIARYQAAFEQDSDFWPAVNNMGLVKYEIGEVDEAIDLWQDAAELAEAAEPQLAIAVALYAKGEQEEGLTLGETAIRIDRRYAELDFLKENLWGTRLLSDARELIQTPRIQATLDQVEEPPPVQIQIVPKSLNQD